MTSARVSIAMAAYNGARFLPEQLASLAGQTLLPHELVVCDDGSDDETAELVEAFGRESPFPVLLHVQERPRGLADNFLDAASRCQGDLVAFCDQDDVWREDKLHQCVAALRDGIELVVHACEVVDQGLNPTGAVFPRIKRPFVAEPPVAATTLDVPGMAMVFSSELIRSVDWRARPRSHFLPGGMVYHDEWIHVLAGIRGRIGFLPGRLVRYRQHEVNVTGSPGGRVGSAAREALTIGREYYLARAHQAREWAELFERLATREPHEALAGRYRSGASFFEQARRRLELRAAPYEADGARARLAAVARIFRAGAYRSRSAGGSGLRGLARDVAMIGLGRHG